MAVLSRIISIAVGLAAGYVGGWVDRVLMFINDIFVADPALSDPGAVLFRAAQQPGQLHAGADHGRASAGRSMRG